MKPFKSKETLFHKTVTGTAGFLVSCSRVLSKYILNDLHTGTLFFFGVSAHIIGFCYLANRTLNRSDFVKYHMGLCRINAESLVLREMQVNFGTIFLHIRVVCW